MQTPSRRQLLAVGAILLCCLPLLASPLTAQSEEYQNDLSNPCVGTIQNPANGTTVVAVQGYSWLEDGGKEPAKLVAIGPDGEVKWVHHTAKHGMVWGYDVDPLPNGNLFVTGTARGKTVVYEFNPRTQEHVWNESLPIHDTHDIDLINNGTQLLVANMRAYNEDKERNDDSIFVYDLQKDEVVWRWYFRNHYPKDTAKNYSKDWTHVNDVDKVGDGLYLASPRNFDQAIVVNRSSNEIEMKLGEDDNYDILHEQHNPDYLESEDGDPTFLVADSENQRIVEYEKQGDDWKRTWELGEKGDLRWPRDADRLPNGNTLIGDSKNQRVIEVTPTGETVWEFYTPWLVYDVERIGTGDGSNGPTIADQNASGSYGLKGDAAKYDAETMKQCHSYLQSIDGWVEGKQPETTTATNGSGVNDDDERNDGNLGGPTKTTDETKAPLPGFDFVVGVVGVLVAVALFARRR